MKMVVKWLKLSKCTGGEERQKGCQGPRCSFSIVRLHKRILSICKSMQLHTVPTWLLAVKKSTTAPSTSVQSGCFSSSTSGSTAGMAVSPSWFQLMLENSPGPTSHHCSSLVAKPPSPLSLQSLTRQQLPGRTTPLGGWALTDTANSPWATKNSHLSNTSPPREKGNGGISKHFVDRDINDDTHEGVWEDWPHIAKGRENEYNLFRKATW